jgi:hypothetical protein
MSSLIPDDVVRDARPEDLKATASAAVEAAPETKEAVADVARNTLTPEQRLELAKELASHQWPTGDWPKAAIYLTGFVVAGAVLCVVGLIAWKAQGGEGSVSSDLVVAASSFVSLLLGGLVGAYVQR